MDARAQGPDIAFGGMERDFRGLVERGADGAGAGGDDVCGCDAEVCEDEVGVGGMGVRADEDVGGFDVAVDDGLEFGIGFGVGGVVGGVAGVDVGEGDGELVVGVPDEGFGDRGAVGEVGG